MCTVLERGVQTLSRSGHLSELALEGKLLMEGQRVYWEGTRSKKQNLIMRQSAARS